ncbi:hypothetical protein KCP73_25800 [Salmonella enterica subsp. enterica]|nr:hypothetical protein KCP73_25800 [Salmonella enterica subsp. enterica]
MPKRVMCKASSAPLMSANVLKRSSSVTPRVSWLPMRRPTMIYISGAAQECLFK